MTSVVGPRMSTDAFAQRGKPVTAREAQVMDFLVMGLNNEEAAARLHISVKTVEAHLSNVRRKAGLGRRVLLAFWWRDSREHRTSGVAS